MMSMQDSFREALIAHLKARGLSASAAARQVGIPIRSLQSYIDGKCPSIERAAAICAGLGFRYVLGPDPSRAVPVPRLATRDATPAWAIDIHDQIAALREALSSRRAPSGRYELREGGAAPEASGVEGTPEASGIDGPANEDALAPAARPVDVVEFAAAAGGGADAAGEEVAGRVWFRRDWLERRGLDPTQCVVIGVKGESMEPTLPDGCSILVDRSRADDWQPGRIYVLRSDDGLMVKRAGKDSGGRRLLLSDHPSWRAAPWPAGAAAVGQVKWMARSL